MGKSSFVALPFSDKPALRVEMAAAYIEILPALDGPSRLEVWGDLSSVEVNEQGGVVSVRASPNSNWWDLGSQKMVVYVPSAVRARVSANMGRVRVEHLAGCDLDITTNAGSLELEDVRGRMTLKAHAGQIRGDGLAGTFNVDSGAGTARLHIVGLDDGVHRVHSNMGSVRVDLAEGLDVRIEARTTMGSTRTQYPNNPQAKAVLQLEAELGSVKVRQANKYDDPNDGDWPDWRKVWGEVEKWTAATLVHAAAAVAHAPAAAHPENVAPKDAELRRILALVQEGKLSAPDAERLIRALD